jgi:hypothetical protein
VIVRFWEARVADNRLDDAVEWARTVLVPAALAAGASGVEVVASPADAPTNNPPRVVVLMRWSSTPDFVEPAIDPTIVDRAHAWNFFSV